VDVREARLDEQIRQDWEDMEQYLNSHFGVEATQVSRHLAANEIVHNKNPCVLACSSFNRPVFSDVAISIWDGQGANPTESYIGLSVDALNARLVVLIAGYADLSVF
jgi:hypothetical protein